MLGQAEHAQLLRTARAVSGHPAPSLSQIESTFIIADRNGDGGTLPDSPPECPPPVIHRPHDRPPRHCVRPGIRTNGADLRLPNMAGIDFNEFLRFHTRHLPGVSLRALRTALQSE